MSRLAHGPGALLPSGGPCSRDYQSNGELQRLKSVMLLTLASEVGRSCMEVVPRSRLRLGIGPLFSCPSIYPIPFLLLSILILFHSHFSALPSLASPVLGFYRLIWLEKHTSASIMGFGVKEPKTVSGEHVPGTATLYDLRGDAVEQGISRASFKRDPKNPDIILVPQPSGSPNDPLVSFLVISVFKPVKLTAV
jgi:hypothetical protein